MSLVLLFETQEVWALKYVHFKIQKKHNYLQATLSSVSVQYPTFSSRPFPNKSTKNHPSEIWKKKQFCTPVLCCFVFLGSWVISDGEVSPAAQVLRTFFTSPERLEHPRWHFLKGKKGKDAVWFKIPSCQRGREQAGGTYNDINMHYNVHMNICI